MLRPHAVYGPGDTTLLPRLESAAVGAWLPIPGGGKVRQHLTHIDTLARAVRAALDADVEPEIAAGRPLVANVADARPVDLNETLELLMFARFRPVQVVGIPIRLANALAWAGSGCPGGPGASHACRGTRSATSRWSAPTTSRCCASASAWTRRRRRCTAR